tara:strand:- start:281 stop:1900 length:1620 start_codon:yes stop_codon:yes gene_type:complete
MQEKYFLFQREDPSLLGGLSFSDNGSGISVLAIPASNVSYMSADRAKIIIFFNDSSFFEESGLIENGESFEKTSVSITCKLGKEVELIEAIINFINRTTTNNFMRFDATGERNTFNQTTSTPVIEAKVRSRASKRGFTGNDSIVKGVLPPAVIGGVDFMSIDKIPVIDYDGENILESNGRAIESLVNSGSGINLSGTSFGSNVYDAKPNLVGPGPICFESDSACSTKTIGFQTKKSIATGTSIINELSSPASLDASVTDVVSNSVSFADNPLATPPTIKITTNGGNVDSATVVYEGANIEVGDKFLYSIANGVVLFTVVAANIASTVHEVGSSTLQLGENLTTDVLGTPYSLSLSDYTVYMTVIVPDDSLFNPLYGANTDEADFLSRGKTTQGPFPIESLGNQFQLNHGGYDRSNNDANNTSIAFPSKNITPKKDSFSYKRSFNEELTSEKNLFSFVIRRNKNNDISIYDRSGELISFKESADDTNGVLDVRVLGLLYPSDISQPQPRIARFGIINKDIGDDHSRNVAIQLNNKYKALI